MTRLLITTLVVWLAALSLGAPSFAQGFDKAAAREAACAQEPNAAQEEICLDRDLTRKDGALNEVYADLRKLMSRDDFARLRREQRAWLKVRNRCGSNTRCLRDIYTDRLAELEQMAENLSNSGKSHVEIGCDGPGQVYRDGRCFNQAAAVIGSNPADGWTWGMTAQNEVNNRGRYTVRLRFGIPETDALAFEAICDAGSSGYSASTKIGYDTTGRTEGATINFSVSIDGRPFRYSGAYYGTQAEYGISGILFNPDFNDPMWEAMAGGQQLAVQVDNGPVTALSLRGSGKPARDFISECKAISSSGRHQATNTAKPSCDAFGQLKSKRSDTPVSLTFINRTDSYRSVMWLNFEGQPVEYANLNPGETFSVNTYLTHPWMFTDGPGNCIEIYLPNQNTSSFDIRQKSPAFGPGND